MKRQSSRYIQGVLLKSIWTMAIACLLLTAGWFPALGQESDPKDNYIVGPGDVLEVGVYDEPDLSKKLRVAPDGYISFPLLGKVYVDGLSANGIEDALTKGLAKDYLVNPHVSVFIAEYGSKKVSVSGEVAKPDVYVLSAKTKLSQILATAGGLTSEAGDVIYLETTRDGEIQSATGDVGSATASRERLTIEAERLLVKGDQTSNYTLKNGDSVFVPKAKKFFVLGEVNKPGEYRLNKGSTILQAIAQAGGFTDIAASSKVKIIRVKEGKKDVLIVNVDELIKGESSGDEVFSIEPDDVILVPESFF